MCTLKKCKFELQSKVIIKKQKYMSGIQLLKINDFKNVQVDEQFYANTIQNHLKSHHSRIEKPHKHNFYAVFLFTKGFGWHEIDFQKHEVKPGSVFFLYPGQTHSWELSDDVEGYLFFHTDEFYNMAYVNNSIRDFPFFESNYTEKCMYLNTDQNKIIQSVFEQLYLESVSDHWKKKQLVLSFLTQMYIQLNRYRETYSELNLSHLKHYRHLFSEFEKLVDQHFKTHKLASEYANMLHITQKHLNRIVKSITGNTTTDIIIKRVLLEAKRKLIYTDHSLNQIATKLGFDDPAYFSRVFRKYENVTASEFRKQY